jgi:hypothetical protein
MEREKCRPKVSCVHALTIGVIDTPAILLKGVIRQMAGGDTAARVEIRRGTQ